MLILYFSEDDKPDASRIRAAVLMSVSNFVIWSREYICGKEKLVVMSGKSKIVYAMETDIDVIKAICKKYPKSQLVLI